MVEPLLASGKSTATVVEFLYGLPEKLIVFTDDAQSVAGAASTPSMEVQVPANTLFLQQQSAEVMLPLDQEGLPTTHSDILGLFTSGRPYPKTYCRISERVESSDGEFFTFYLFAGYVELAHANPEGFPNRVKLTINPVTLLNANVRLGLPIDATCTNTFGDASCGFNLPAATQTGNINITPAGGRAGDYIVSVPGLTVQTLPDDTGLDPFYFVLGLMQFDGLGIRIRGWSLVEPSLFRLARKPPPYWQSRNIQVSPGCLRDRSACMRNRREISFNGLGIGIPDFDPFSQIPTR